jgi:hypothetical protein
MWHRVWLGHGENFGRSLNARVISERLDGSNVNSNGWVVSSQVWFNRLALLKSNMSIVSNPPSILYDLTRGRDTILPWGRKHLSYMGTAKYQFNNPCVRLFIQTGYNMKIHNTLRQFVIEDRM